MRRKKEKTFDPKFDSIIEQADLINDTDALLDWYQSIVELYDGTDRATILEIYTKRRDALIKAKEPTDLTIIYPAEDKKEEVEAEVVDEPTETAAEPQEIEFNDKIGMAYRDYEEEGRRLVKQIREVTKKIETKKAELKELNALKEELRNAHEALTENGHEAFIKQPTLFDNLEGGEER